MNRCFKWISERISVWCLTEEPALKFYIKVLSSITCPHVGQIPPLSQSCCHLHNAPERQNQKAETSKSCHGFFFFHTFSSFHFCLFNLSSRSSPNHQPLGLACHCWVSHSSSEGPQTFFSLFFPPWICRFIGACGSHQSAKFIVQTGWGQGQVDSQESPEKRGSGLAMPCGLHALGPLLPNFNTPLTPTNPTSSGTQRLGRSAACLRGHLAVHRGWDILYKSPCHLDSDKWRQHSDKYWWAAPGWYEVPVHC